MASWENKENLQNTEVGSGVQSSGPRNMADVLKGLGSVKLKAIQSPGKPNGNGDDESNKKPKQLQIRHLRVQRHVIHSQGPSRFKTVSETGMMQDTTRFYANNMNTMNNPNVNVLGVINQNMNGPNTPNFNVPSPNNPNMMNPNNHTGPNFNDNVGMNNFNPAPNMNNFNPSAGINNFAPNSGINNLNQPRGRPMNFGSATFFPGSTGQTFNFNTQGKKK